MSFNTQTKIDNNWIKDTGATDHMINDKQLLSSSCTPKQSVIHTASGETEKVICEGSVRVSNSMNLDSVLVVPSSHPYHLTCYPSVKLQNPLIVM